MTTEDAARVEARIDVSGQVQDERDRQDKMFGDQRHDPAYWYSLLGKQIGQLGEMVVRHKWAADPLMGRANMYIEAIQVAAVAQAFAEAIRRDTILDEVETAMPRDPRQRAVALNHGDESVHAKMAEDNIEDTELPAMPRGEM